MIYSIKIEFKKLDKDVRSDTEYDVFLKFVDYTEYNETTGENACVYASVGSAIPLMIIAEKRIIKAKGILDFIQKNVPSRTDIVYVLEKNNFRYSNHALNCLEIYI